MNAYELADRLDANVWGGVHPDIKKCSNMLRQQADRIAELEKKLQESAMNYISICSQADEHYARVQELEKQGEPVAWMQMHHKDNVPTKFSPVKVWEDDIPLYTTPQTKPLSDEETEAINRLNNPLGNVGGKPIRKVWD